MTENKKLKVVFAPGALAEMEKEMTPEEIQAFVEEFQHLVESGELLDRSESINMDSLEQDDPELFAQLQTRMIAEGFTDMEDWMEAQYQPPTLN